MSQSGSGLGYCERHGRFRGAKCAECAHEKNGSSPSFLLRKGVLIIGAVALAFGGFLIVGLGVTKIIEFSTTPTSVGLASYTPTLTPMPIKPTSQNPISTQAIQTPMSSWPVAPLPTETFVPTATSEFTFTPPLRSPTPITRILTPRTPTATPKLCATPGKLLEPLPRDARRTKPGGRDAITFRWEPAPGGLAPGYAYRIHIVAYSMRDPTVKDNEGAYTSSAPSRLLEKAEAQYMVHHEQDVNIHWWVTVMKKEGLDQYGNFTGPDCSLESEHTYFPLYWSP